MLENVLIVGCGDTGKRVIEHLTSEKHRSIKTISVTSHREDSQSELNKLRNIQVINADLDDAASLASLPTENTNIFYFAPPAATGSTDVRMANFITALNPNNAPKRIVYISTSGVYGTSNGEWVTELSSINPGNDRSKRRLHAESLVQTFCEQSKCEYVILRVTGIYCLEKLPFKRLKTGMKVLQPALAPFSNRIHADDLANCCVKAMFDSPKNEIFNIADGNPSSISDYFIQIAKIFDLPQPELLDWERAEKEISPAMLSYLHESKKINIDKLRNVLNIKLKHPNLIDGLKACRIEKKQTNETFEQ